MNCLQSLLKFFQNCFNNIYKNNNNNNNNNNNDNNDNQIILWDDTIPFKVPISEGYVIKVYDGDTLTVAARLPFDGSPIYRFSVRLNGIDAPEMKSKFDEEIQMAKVAKHKLSELILNKCVSLQNVNTEKYGRILADVYIDNIYVNGWMVEQKLAVKYDGGTKHFPKSWLKYYITGSYD